MYARENLIKNLNRVFRRGYVPLRLEDDYSGFSFEGIAVSHLYNCLAHACFGYTNRMIITTRLTSSESECFGNFNNGILTSPKDVESELIKLVSAAGLKVHLCPKDALLKNNQWKVALYFKDGYGKFNDFHFLKYEPKKDLWTGKFSHYSKIEIFDKLPEKYDRLYKFYNTYAITNPYAESENT